MNAGRHLFEWRVVLWGLLTVQAVAFAIGIAVFSQPPPPSEVPDLSPVTSAIYRTLAVLGFGLTVLDGWLFVPPSRGFRRVDVAVEASILVIAVFLLHADPRALSATLCALTAAALAVLSLRVLATARSQENL